MKKNRDPVRMCAACRELKPRSELFRLAATEKGAVYDPSGHLEGRGVYVCRDRTCIERLGKQRRRSRDRRSSVTGDQMERLLAEMHGNE